MNVDNDEKEEISIFDVNAELVFRTFDPKSWGHIDFKGFVGLCVILISRKVRASETMVDMTASEIRKISLDDVSASQRIVVSFARLHLLWARDCAFIARAKSGV